MRKLLGFFFAGLVLVSAFCVWYGAAALVMPMPAGRFSRKMAATCLPPLAFAAATFVGYMILESALSAAMLPKTWYSPGAFTMGTIIAQGTLFGWSLGDPRSIVLHVDSKGGWGARAVSGVIAYMPWPVLVQAATVWPEVGLIYAEILVAATLMCHVVFRLQSASHDGRPKCPL